MFCTMLTTHGAFFSHRGAKILAAGQLGARRDQCDKHLAVGGTAQHRMAQKPGASVLVVGGPAAGSCGVQHSGQRFVQNILLQQAVRTGQDLVRALGVQAADELAMLGSKASDSLVAIMQRVGHALHGLDRRKAAQQFLQAGLLLGQLFPVGHGQQRTSTAFFGKIQAGSGHGDGPFFNDSFKHSRGRIYAARKWSSAGKPRAACMPPLHKCLRTML